MTHVEVYTPLPGAHGPSSGLTKTDYDKVLQASMSVLSEPNDTKYNLLRDLLEKLKRQNSRSWASHHHGSVPARFEIGLRLSFASYNPNLLDAMMEATGEAAARLFSTDISMHLRTCKTSTWKEYNSEVFSQMVDFFVWRMHPKLVQPSVADVEEFCSLFRLPEILRNCSWNNPHRRLYPSEIVRSMGEHGVFCCRRLLRSLLRVDLQNGPMERLQWYRRSLLLTDTRTFTPSVLWQRTLPAFFRNDHHSLGILQSQRIQVLYHVFGVLAPVEWLARNSIAVAIRLEAVGNLETPSELHICAIAFVEDRQAVEHSKRNAWRLSRFFAPAVVRSWMTGDQEDRRQGVMGALFGSNFFEMTSSSSGTDLWMARISGALKLASEQTMNSLFFPDESTDLSSLCTSLVDWSCLFTDNPIQPSMGFAEVIAGRVARSYRAVFGENFECQMKADMQAMFDAYNFTPRTGAWYPLPTRSYLRRNRKLELVHVSNEGSGHAQGAMDDEMVNELFIQAGVGGAGDTGHERQRREFLAKLGLVIHHCLQSLHQTREGFGMEIVKFRRRA